jgi:hypothetical protein
VFKSYIFMIESQKISRSPSYSTVFQKDLFTTIRHSNSVCKIEPCFKTFILNFIVTKTWAFVPYCKIISSILFTMIVYPLYRDYSNPNPNVIVPYNPPPSGLIARPCPLNQHDPPKKIHVNLS